jgi:hypothetical protein
LSPSDCGLEIAAYEIISAVSTECLPWEKGYTKKTNHMSREIVPTNCGSYNTPCRPVQACAALWKGKDASIALRRGTSFPAA